MTGLRERWAVYGNLLNTRLFAKDPRTIHLTLKKLLKIWVAFANFRVWGAGKLPGFYLKGCHPWKNKFLLLDKSQCFHVLLQSNWYGWQFNVSTLKIPVDNQLLQSFVATNSSVFKDCMHMTEIFNSFTRILPIPNLLWFLLSCEVLFFLKYMIL